MSQALRLHDDRHLAESEPTILVGVAPGMLRDATLVALLHLCEGVKKNCALRTWLSAEVRQEIGRREQDTLGNLEPQAWIFHWHSMTDGQLAAALCTTLSWLRIDFDDEVANVLYHVHRVVVSAAATRLSELDEAIRRARKD